MREEFIRTGMIFGETAMKKLAASRVAVFGIGGVGGHVVEALARSGIGALDLIDNDRVAPSNLNRQIVATQSTIGQFKTEAAEKRIHDISPDCKVRTFNTFFMPDTADEFDFTQYDYVVDAIDTVTGKIEIIMRAKAAGVPVISSMGAGNKVDPTAFEVADIYKTSVCPLARVMRREMKKRGVKALKVVYSKEEALTPIAGMCTDGGSRRSTPGSNAFVPSVAGLIIAGEVIKDLTGFSRK
ncbi:MAG: tRNA threonylcarbamoyladenosine dehydratase [Ruminococcus sp.]|nr:tRNA threonylcarbamoyladenosine dehydratase [Ruminococcus sp.]